jgi:hypothetical protein
LNQPFKGSSIKAQSIIYRMKVSEKQSKRLPD